MNDNKFTTGLILGIILGGGAVFFLGTKTGRNLMKILSERGMDGLVELLEEYNFDDLERESFDSAQDLGKPRETETQSEAPQSKTVNHQAEEKEAAPKKHFFKRVRK